MCVCGLLYFIISNIFLPFSQSCGIFYFKSDVVSKRTTEVQMKFSSTRKGSLIYLFIYLLNGWDRDVITLLREIEELIVLVTLSHPKLAIYKKFSSSFDLFSF